MADDLNKIILFSNEVKQQMDEFKANVEASKEVPLAHQANIISSVSALLKSNGMRPLKTADGAHVFLKESITRRQVAPVRVTEACENMTVKQLADTAATLEHRTGRKPSVLDTICVCLQEQIENVCVIKTEGVAITKTRPKSLGNIEAQEAPAGVQRDIATYLQCEEQLKVIRSQARKGNEAFRGTQQKTNEKVAQFAESVLGVSTLEELPSKTRIVPASSVNQKAVQVETPQTYIPPEKQKLVENLPEIPPLLQEFVEAAAKAQAQAETDGSRAKRAKVNSSDHDVGAADAESESYATADEDDDNNNSDGEQTPTAGGKTPHTRKTTAAEKEETTESIITVPHLPPNIELVVKPPKVKTENKVPPIKPADFIAGLTRQNVKSCVLPALTCVETIAENKARATAVMNAPADEKLFTEIWTEEVRGEFAMALLDLRVQIAETVAKQQPPSKRKQSATAASAGAAAAKPQVVFKVKKA